MLWLSLYFPQLPLELHQPADGAPTVACDREGSRRYIIASNETANEAGLHRGLDVTTALARVPQLRVIERQRTQERAALKALCAWAEQYSNTICSDPDRWLVWIEIGASLHYFNGLDALLRQLQASVHVLGYTACIGVAPTLEAAALFARHSQGRPVTDRARCRTVLSPLPLSRLALPPQTIDALQEVGWKTIGETLALPHDQLARRFGPELPRYLQRLLGDTPDPRPLYRSPATYHRVFEFAYPIDHLESMLFPLRRLLMELQGYLRGRDTALQQLQLSLSHEQVEPTTLSLQTTTPQRDGQRLFELLRERLANLAFTAPICVLTLQVSQFVVLGDTQLNLFEVAPQREQDWANLIDKLRSRLGDQAVRHLGLQDDYLPEKAWCRVDQPRHDLLPADYPDRPLWLITPRALQTLPTLLGKPERIESGWWNEQDTRRDYYIAQTAEGSKWWLYKDADTSQWFLHGLWG